MEKTIKYLENGEYHYATVRSVGDLAQLKTDSKETLVEAINELWNGGGNADPSKAPKPEGYDQLVQDVADAVKNQQEISQQWIEWQNEEAQLTEERKQAYLQAMKEMQEAIDKAKADAAALDDKTTKLDEQITKTFSDLDTSIQNMHEQLQKEADRMNQELIDTKSDLTKVRTDLQNAQLDNGRIHDELTNINGKFEHKVWQTDLDPLKAQIDRAETSVQQTKDELLGKASREDLDTVTNAVSKLDTQLKETAKGVEISVKKDELGGDVARLLNDKTNLLLGTRSFSGEDNWRNRDKVTIEPGYYKGMKTAAVQVTDASIYQPYRVKANTAYTFSFFGKEDRDNPKATLVIKPIDAQNVNVDGGEQQVHITTEWQRFAVTFSVDQECEISIQIIQGPEATNNILHLAGLKLQYGQNDTPWEPNEADVAENIEHTESQFNVYSDQIAGIVKKQEKMGDTERQLDTRITETAEGLKQTSKDLQDANGKITEFKGQLESTARGLKTEYEKYTNDAVGQISDSTLNLIRNSSFQNKDSDFDQWQNISAKANVRSDENGLRWVELTQSGMTTDNPQGLTSNYFNVKQGKVTIAVDIKSGDKASLDNDSVLSLELYNDVKKRVDFYDVSLSQLGLSKELLGDHKVHRGLYRLGIDRNDAKYMTVKAKLVKNGDLYFTNFSARLSSIDDGAYEPNPDDLNQQILKQNTKIEQNAKEVAIKANSVDVTRDIKSAVQNSNGGGINLIKKSSFHNMTIDQVGNAWSIGQGVSINPKGGTGSAGSIIIDAQNIVDSNSYTEITQSIDVEPNTDYTFSLRLLWGKAASGKSFNAYTFMVEHTSDGGTTSPYQDNNRHIANSPSRSANTYTVHTSANTHSLLLYIRAMGGSYIELEEVKLERGPVATPWTPNSQDTSEEIKSAKDAAIKVASDQINIHVNELTTSFDDKLNKRVNEVKTASEKFTSDGIEQTVKKITDVKNQVDGVNDRVNNLKVGGRNIALNTDRDIVIDDTGNAGAQGWCFATIPLTQQPKIGDQVTVSAEGTLIGRGDLSSYSAILFNSTTSNGRSNLANLISGKRASVTLTVNNLDGEGDTVLLLYAGKQADTEGKKNVVHHLKVEFGNVATDWTPAPEDINQSIKDATEYKTVTGTIDFNNLKTQQKIFYKDLQATNTPAGGNYWYYLDVEPGYDGRILQTAISDRDNITWVRTFVDSWSPWIRQADQRNVDDLNNQISSFKTETTASVKNLGDRVTTEVNSITTRQNNFENETKAQHSNDVELVRKSDFEDGSKGNWTVTGVVPATNPAPPAELGQSGMKVLQTNTRDGYEDGIWYSVKPGEKFDVDYWCASSTAFHTTFGLNFVDKNKENNNWQGVSSDQSGQWKHYTGTITAPANASFARPWFQMEKPFNNTINSSWIAKPHIRRQNPQVAEKISELNTKWDVANGQIQGKVTESQVNNILNSKGYATQSWAQSNFRMKSDSISLEVKEITDPISNRVNNVNSKLDNLQVGGTNLANKTNQGTINWTCDPGNGTTNLTEININGNRGVRFNNTNKTTSWWVVKYALDLNKFEPTTDYVISFDIRTPMNVELYGGMFDIAGGDSANGYFTDTSIHGVIPANKLTHISVSKHTKDNFDKDHYQSFYLNSWNLSRCDWVDFVNFKIEKGNKATDWSPAPEDTSAEIKSAKDDAINVASGKIDNSNKELQGKINSAKDSAENRAQELESRLNTTKNELQDIKAITQWHTVSGPIDLNDLKTQTRIFYRDIQDKNSAVTGWQYIVVDSSSDKVTQTVWKDNSTVQYIRQFTGTWTNWVRQTNQNDIDEAKTGLREEIKSAKDAAINVAKDNIEIKVNELKTTYEETLNTKINEVKTASEKFTSDGIEQTVSKITEVQSNVDNLNEKVDSNNGGGINLQKGTKDFSFQIGTNGNPSSIETYNSDTKMLHTQNGGFYTSYSDSSFVPTPGEFYTLSADVKGDGTINGSGFRYEGGNNGTMGNITLSDTWQRIINTVHVDKVQGQWVIYPTNSKNLYVKHIKIERGTVATPWTAAPEDVQTQIDANKTAANNAQNTANTANSMAGNAVTNASSAVSVANNANTTANQAKSNANSAVTTANNAKSTADSANTTANQANNNASSAVNTANQAKSNATQAVNTANSANSKINDIQSSGGGRNLLQGTRDFKQFGNLSKVAVTNGQDKFQAVTGTGSSSATYYDIVNFWNLPLEKDTDYTASFWVKTSEQTDIWSFLYDSGSNGNYADGATKNQSTTDYTRVVVHFHNGNNTATPSFIPVRINKKSTITVWLYGCMLEKGTIAHDWTPAPEDVNQGIKDATEYKTVTGTIDFNNLKTQQKIFYKDLQATNTPAGGNYWYYLDVEPGYDGRILQTAISDRDNITWVRTFVDNWSPWIRQADQRNVDDLNNQISSFKTETTASVKNLGDRVTTQVNSITTRMSDQIANAVELIQKSDFSDGSKGSWTVQSIISATNPAPPAELGISGMKVIQSNVRDSYEDVWHSVTPGEKFNVDFWCAPSGVYDSLFGLVFYDANKKLVPNNQWLGVRTDHSGQWRHYTGEITAPGNSAFAKPWFQIDKPANNTENSSWLAKPHIRRQDPRVTEAIKEVNTKWDVANGQIQGKVTETQVNNILNGKGYATQSWAQTQFQMRSDAITLQAVRDNITNGIQNQVNDTRNQINGLQNQFNTQTGINLLKGTADFSGPWFNKNGKGWSYSGDWQPPTSENKSERNNNVVYQDSGHAWDGLGQTVELDTGEYTFSMWMWPTLSGNESMNIYAGDSQYGGTAKVNYSGYSYSASQPQDRWILVKTYLTVTQGGKLSIRPELNQASGTIHVASYMLQHGHVENPVWAPAPDDLAPKSIISSINITPDQIKIASNKIVIDGNTDIHGVLRVPDVKLAGRNGNVDLSGDGINITKTNGAGINIASNGIQLTANTNGQNEIEGVITTAWSMNDKNQNGIGLVITPEQTLGRPYGGDILTIGSMAAPGTIHAGMVFDATGINPDYRRGFNWFAPHTLSGDGGVLRFPGAQDDLMLYPGNVPESRQSEYSQPTLRLVHGNSQGSAGVQFQWNDIVPFGRITSSMSYVSAVGTDDDGGITVSWYSYGAWYGGRKAPSIVYRGSDGSRGNGGIVFYPYGEVCFWQGDFHSNLRWSGMKNTD